jgi:two-component system, OmpR family, sensor histidine kinase KdpD
VVCAVQRHDSPGVEAALQKLEMIPTLKIGDAEAIDVPAVLRRHPRVALIDGLAYDNPPGSPHAHRWQDVEELLEAGISVITTINLQYLEKLQDEVERITGQRAPCNIPRAFLDAMADEVVVVDAPAVENLAHAGSPADRATHLEEELGCRGCASWRCWSPPEW